MTEWAEGPSILEHISTHWHIVCDPVQFVMRYATAVRRYVGTLVKNPHDSEDVVADFLLQTVRQPFRPEQIRRGRFRDYLKAVLRNAARSHFRRTAHAPSLGIDCLASVAEAEKDRAWIADWRECLLRRAWQALELHQQAAPE